jgi:hypothetical protein
MKTDISKVDRIVTVLACLLSLLIGGCPKMSESIQDKATGMNGSFEVTESGRPVNWLIYTPKTVPTGDYDLIIDTSAYKDGKQSLKFLVRACSDKGGWHSPGLCQEYAAIPGKTYKVSFWIKNAGCEFAIGIGGVSGSEGDYETVIKSKDTIEAWKYFEYQYKMPMKKDFQRIRFYLNILSPGSFWIDDVNIDGPDGDSLVPCTR